MKTTNTKWKPLALACLALAFMGILNMGPAPAWSAQDALAPPSGTESGDLPDSQGTPPPPTLWVVGDSTAAAFQDTNYYYPRYGWGTQLDRYFQGITIENLAVSGTSSQSFLQTSQYRRLLQEIEAGDYVVIGFGHNDENRNPCATPIPTPRFPHQVPSSITCLSITSVRSGKQGPALYFVPPLSAGI